MAFITLPIFGVIGPISGLDDFAKERPEQEQIRSGIEKQRTGHVRLVSPALVCGPEQIQRGGSKPEGQRLPLVRTQPYLFRRKLRDTAIKS